MPRTDRYRALYVLKYLWDYTEDEHPATLAQIRGYLEAQGIKAIPRTIDKDIKELMSLGYDVMCSRGRQNQYHFAFRGFTVSELKLMIDAVQAARFIPQGQTEELVERIAGLASAGQADKLKRNLYVSKLKHGGKSTLNMADWLNAAINEDKKVSFQYYEYDRRGKRVFKHNGARYLFSPYTLVWNMDNYYIIGYSEKHGGVIKFRTDKICNLRIERERRTPLPDGFDIAEYCDSMFLMYGSERKKLKLYCEYSVINKVIDRFGEEIEIIPADEDHFWTTITAMTGATFYSWIFNYMGKIRIAAPGVAVKEFENMLHSFDR